ncbi:patatin-like phospholipase family protein [Mycobacterium deserti]|uniref:Patatin-like phospholipase family protein n=1 Tax=Mycobacterium deserti TaxID=2978347 RepID=A0ABT2M7S6_9MYCO|nr:patatin-like phospholipase family protein [Mycobacterium deserti]MCT7658304.1 patatin-like phospholipase family protein [Mycobacterium deserti]
MDPTSAPTDKLLSPARETPEDKGRQPEDGLALCLSGGGYRAMIFHVGVLWRLNEIGLLPDLKRISAVSGGSITAGVLAMNWSRLDWSPSRVAVNFDEAFVEPVRRMGRTAVDVRAVLTGILPFGDSVSDRVAAAYREHLFGDTSLQALPETPQFIFNSTNLESGVLLRFSKKYLGDYRVGRVMNPDIPLAVAVAASSAFPPVLSPCTLNLKGQAWVDDAGNDLTTPGFRDEIQVTDGGVYDNLGLETAWKRYASIIVSDAGGQLADDDDPDTDPLRQTARVLNLIDNQVRSLRKRQVVESFKSGQRSGVYIGIRSRVEKYPGAVLTADPARTDELAGLKTRLAPLSDAQQDRLINWGYVICDAGLRSHMPHSVKQPAKTALPYANQPLT